MDARAAPCASDAPLAVGVRGQPRRPWQGPDPAAVTARPARRIPRRAKSLAPRPDTVEHDCGRVGTQARRRGGRLASPPQLPAAWTGGPPDRGPTDRKTVGRGDGDAPARHLGPAGRSVPSNRPAAPTVAAPSRTSSRIPTPARRPPTRARPPGCATGEPRGDGGDDARDGGEPERGRQTVGERAGDQLREEAAAGEERRPGRRAAPTGSGRAAAGSGCSRGTPRTARRPAAGRRPAPRRRRARRAPRGPAPAPTAGSARARRSSG